MASTVFKSLTDTTFDSVEGYRQAAETANNSQLTQALQQRGQERGQTLQQLCAQASLVSHVACRHVAGVSRFWRAA